MRYCMVFILIPLLLNAHEQIPPSTYIHARYHYYYAHALQWIDMYIQDQHGTLLVSDADLYAIEQLLYYSYARSCITLCAQEHALRLLCALWHGWQNITHTRRNPSLALPYPDLCAPPIDKYADFFEQVSMHRSIGSEYARRSHALVKEHQCETVLAHDAITQLRNDAQAVVATALADIQPYISQLYADALQEVRPLKKYHKKGIVTLQKGAAGLLSALPSYARKYFTDADILSMKASEKLWNMLISLQKVSNKAWHTLEQERGAFYYAHYHALHATFPTEFRSTNA
jgi:hypothetical protein